MSTQAPTHQMQADWIQRINEEAINSLTPWETTFMESITEKFDRGMSLGERELEILENIYTEKTP